MIMNRRFLLNVFKRTLSFILLTTLFGGTNSFAQTSGYGDFIIFEDFGQADPDNPSQHEYYSAADNTIAGISVPVYFRKAELSDIHLNNLLFYIPSNPPSPSGQSTFGPQYRDTLTNRS